MNTNHDALREAAEKVCLAWEADPTDPTAFGSAMDKAVADLQLSLSQPPAPEQASGELCQGCNGSGTVTLMTGHLGPDDYEYDADCEACHGTGSGDILDAIKALSYQPHTVKSCVQMVDRAAVLRIIKARADLHAATPAAPVAAKPVGTIGHIGGDDPTLTAALTPILALAAKPEPECKGDFGECSFNGGCMYAYGGKPDPQTKGEPKVVAEVAQSGPMLGVVWTNINDALLLADGTELITLQSHREALAQHRAALEESVGALQWVAAQGERDEWGYCEKAITHANQVLEGGGV